MIVRIYIQRRTKTMNVVVFLETSVIANDSCKIRIPNFQNLSIDDNKQTEIRK